MTDITDVKMEESMIEYKEAENEHTDWDFPPNLANYPEPPTIALIQQGYALLDDDKALSNVQALKVGWRQVLNCAPFILSCIGQGYDSGAASIIASMPSFLVDFGSPKPGDPTANYVPSLWLSLWSAFVTLGMAIGAVSCGTLVDRFGPRRTSMVTSTLMIAAVSLQCFAVNRIMLLFGKLLAGIPMGIFIVSASNFISESVNMKLRAPLSSLIPFSTSIGLVFGLTTGNMNLGQMVAWKSWRMTLACQYIFPALTVLGLIFAADSPVYAVRQGKPAVARKMLGKLYGIKDVEVINARLAAIQHTVAAEEMAHEHYGNAGWAELMSNPVDAKRTLTSVGVWVAQVMGGMSFLAQGIYFLSQLDIEFTVIFGITAGLASLSAVVSFFTGYIIEFLGRRTVFVYGNIAHTCVLIAIGGLGWASSQKAGWALALLMNLALSTQGFAVNAPAYTLMNELSSVRLRAKTQAVATCALNIFACAFNLMTPYIFQTPGNLGAKTALIFAGLNVFVVVFGFLYVPETRNRTAAEIDVLYENHIAARHFAKTDTAALMH